MTFIRNIVTVDKEMTFINMHGEETETSDVIFGGHYMVSIDNKNY